MNAGKKRLLAIVLTLALCTVLFIPASAAVKPEDATNANHTHVYNILYTHERYDYFNVTYHIEVWKKTETCRECPATIVTYENGSYLPHNNGTYCTECNHRVSPTFLPGEIMSLEDTDSD